MSQTKVELDIQKVFAGVVSEDRPYDKMSGFAALDNNLNHGKPAFFRDFANRTLVASGNDAAGSGRGDRTDFVDGIVMYEGKESGSPSKAGDEAALLRKGVIWVQTAGAVTAGAPVFLDVSTGELATGTPETGDKTLHGLNFLTSTTGADLAILEVNLPNSEAVAA